MYNDRYEGMGMMMKCHYYIIEVKFFSGFITEILIKIRKIDQATDHVNDQVKNY